MLTNFNGIEVGIGSVRLIDTSIITLYNFEVEDNHDYFVGDDLVLVHNDCNEKWLSPTYSKGKHVLGTIGTAWAKGLEKYRKRYKKRERRIQRFIE